MEQFIMQIVSTLGLPGLALFVFWKVALRVIGAWKDNNAGRNTLENTRLTQQHEQSKALADAIACLSDRVHENTQESAKSVEAVRELVAETRDLTVRMERLVDNVTPPDGVRAFRHG